MGHTVEDWHRELAEIMYGTRSAYDLRTRLSSSTERENTVTVWRHTAFTANLYASAPGGENWVVWWDEALTRDMFLGLIKGRSLPRRNSADGVARWEIDLANSMMQSDSHAAAAREYGKAEPIRRLSLELDVTLSVAAAYTRCSLEALRTTMQECREFLPPCTVGDGPHLLLDLIKTNRPTA